MKLRTHVVRSRTSRTSPHAMMEPLESRNYFSAAPVGAVPLSPIVYCKAALAIKANLCTINAQSMRMQASVTPLHYRDGSTVR